MAGMAAEKVGSLSLSFKLKALALLTSSSPPRHLSSTPA